MKSQQVISSVNQSPKQQKNNYMSEFIMINIIINIIERDEGNYDYSHLKKVRETLLMDISMSGDPTSLIKLRNHFDKQFFPEEYLKNKEIKPEIAPVPLIDALAGFLVWLRDKLIGLFEFFCFDCYFLNTATPKINTPKPSYNNSTKSYLTQIPPGPKIDLPAVIHKSNVSCETNSLINNVDDEAIYSNSPTALVMK